MMSVAVKGGTSIETGTPKALFQTTLRVASNKGQYAVSGDGNRFLFGEPVDEGNAPVTMVLNWAAGLKR